MRGWGRFTVNGGSDTVEDAKFELYGSNYPLVQPGVPIIGFFHIDHFVWAGSVNGQRVVWRGRGCEIWIVRFKLPLGPTWWPYNRKISFRPFCVAGVGPRSTVGLTRSRMRNRIVRVKLPLVPSWYPHNRIISFWPFGVGGVGRRSTGGLMRSRMRNLNCMGQITRRSKLVAPIIGLFNFDHFAWAGLVHGQRVVWRGRRCEIWIVRIKLPLCSSWCPHNRIISFWPFCVGGVGPWSTVGPTRSWMRDLNFTGLSTPRSSSCLHNRFISFWPFCMGGVGPRSTGGPTRSRMPDLIFTGEITPIFKLASQ